MWLIFFAESIKVSKKYMSTVNTDVIFQKQQKQQQQ